MYYDQEEEETKDNICPLCGLRQYSDVCSVCNIKIKEEDEKEKTKDDDDEYDWRERR
ncbi:MAG TPA: hypothetical protein PKZ36_03005 [Candidatus Paceibacterota bacterium]|nr:hypothetical protein [Candidatus Paceibacterota bacterium]HPT18348.1 hypothetical protein [Candidatus Paceibacterota bacterium]